MLTTYLVCALVVCACVYTAEAALDAVCTVDGNCTVSANEACLGTEGSKKCQCKALFTAKGDGTCIAVLGSTCTVETAATACTAKVADSDCMNNATCTCKTLYFAKDNACVRGIGAMCTDNANCSHVAGAMCSSSKCACMPYYRNTDNKTCTKGLDAACTAMGQCSSIVPNSNCTNGFCKCTSLYKQMTDHCMPVLGSDCSGEADCRVVGNANCTGSKCQCTANYTMKVDVCIVGLGNPCTENAACEANMPHSYCGTDMKCTCHKGYKTSGMDCIVSSAGAVSVGFVAMATCVMALLMG